MTDVAERIRSDNSLERVQPSLASIKSVFDLLDYEELAQAKLKYARDEAER